MSLLRPLSDWKIMLAATLLLVAAWNIPVLGLLIIPAFVLLLELAFRPGRAFLKLYLVTALWNAATTYWIANAHPLGVIATVFINGALMAAALWLGARSSTMIRRFPKVEGWSALAYMPIFASWIAFEKLHDHWGLAFPWLNLGNTFNGTPIFVQWYKWLGATGGTLWVLVVAMAVFEWQRGRWRKDRPLLLFLVPLLTSISLWSLPNSSKPLAWIKVAVVQPNINAYTEKWELPEGEQIEKVRRLLQTHLGDSQVDLIVLPETFLPKARQEDNYGLTPTDKLLHEILDTFGDAAIFGATTYDFQDEPNVYNRPMGNRYYTLYNSALFRNLGARDAHIYHKGKLVVGGETMPFVQLLKPYLGDWAIELGGTSGTLGISEERIVFDNGKGLKLGPIICWENEFSDYTTDYTKQGANLLAVITNDGWWGDTQGHVQHMRFSGLRAIENGRWIVRSANTGISCVIDQKGGIHEPLGWEEEGVIVMEVPLLEGQTIYSRTGDWIGRLMVLLFVLNLGVLLFSRFFRLKPR